MRRADLPQVAVVAPQYGEAWEAAKALEAEHEGYEFVAVGPRCRLNGYRFAYVHSIDQGLSYQHPSVLGELHRALCPDVKWWEDRDAEDQRPSRPLP